jgi:hypothetical protein
MKEYLHCKGRKIQPTPANSARGEKYNQPPPIQPGEETRDQTQKKEKIRKKEQILVFIFWSVVVIKF